MSACRCCRARAVQATAPISAGLSRANPKLNFVAPPCGNTARPESIYSARVTRWAIKAVSSMFFIISSSIIRLMQLAPA